jgi:hypothetical protein
MGSAFSVTLNIITIAIVAITFYIGSELYRTRSDKAMTASEIFDKMWIEPDTVVHSYFVNKQFGPIGDFTSYDWDRVYTTTI